MGLPDEALAKTVPSVLEEIKLGVNKSVVAVRGERRGAAPKSNPYRTDMAITRSHPFDFGHKWPTLRANGLKLLTLLVTP